MMDTHEPALIFIIAIGHGSVQAVVVLEMELLHTDMQATGSRLSVTLNES